MREGTAVISARNLGRRYGEKRVLRAVDLDVPSGGFALITGPNGAGKTTLLRICAGLQIPTEGELKDWVKHHLARYKVPREIVFLDELPRNATGKILKRELAELE